MPADPDAFVFTGPGGGRLRHSAFYRRAWVPTLKRLGLPRIGLHALRHSAVALMIATDTPPKAIQPVIGHSSVAFTYDKYGHMFDDDLDAVADRLDQRLTILSRPVRGLRDEQRFVSGDDR